MSPLRARAAALAFFAVLCGMVAAGHAQAPPAPAPAPATPPALSILVVDVQSLRPLWTAWDNIPGLALTNFNNTVVLGSVVAWLLLFLPIFFLARFGVLRYRATVGARVRQSRFYKALQASQLYNVYTWFRP